MKLNRVHGAIIAAVLVSLVSGRAALPELPPEEIGVTEVLPEALPMHWVWVVDAGTSFSRALLFDGDTGEMKAQLDTGYWSPGMSVADDRKSIYVNETHFAHGARGPRHDLLTVYDAHTLTPQMEIPVPPRRMTALTMRHMTGITGDGRILGITNFTPMRSLSLVNLTTGTLLGEEDTPGCGQVYPAGDNRLMTLCGDGSFLTFTMTRGEDGQVTVHRSVSPAFFDPDEDPVIIPAAQFGDRWLFASFNGDIHEVDAATDQPRLDRKWSLLTDKERRKEWRTSGFQGIARHEPTGRLYALMHRGAEETYEEPGEEVWIYDTQTRQRLIKVELEHPTVSIAVTRDAAPLLFASGFKTIVPTWMLFILGITGQLGDIFIYLTPVVDVYDAHTGKHLRTIEGTGTFPVELIVP